MQKIECFYGFRMQRYFNCGAYNSTIYGGFRPSFEKKNQFQNSFLFVWTTNKPFLFVWTTKQRISFCLDNEFSWSGQRNNSIFLGLVKIIIQLCCLVNEKSPCFGLDKVIITKKTLFFF